MNALGEAQPQRYATVVTGVFSASGMSTFLGLFVQQRVAHSAAASAVALFVLYAGGAVGTVLAGRPREPSSITGGGDAVTGTVPR